MLKPAYSYARYSTDKQQICSIEQQQDEARQYAEKHGYTIVREYADAALSGKSATTRPSFIQMHQDVETNRDNVQAVIVYKTDRYARSARDTAIYLEILDEYSVELLSVTERIDRNTAFGKFEVNLKSVLNAHYIDNLTEDICRAMTAQAKEGLFNGGHPPLGYYIQDRQYCIKDDEAEIVRYIYQAYSDCLTYGDIIEQLHIRGMKTRSGKCFSKVGVYDILHREIYDGTYVWGRQAKRRSDGSRSKKKKPDDQVIRIPNAVPSIVDKAIFDDVKQRLSDRGRGGRSKTKEVYLLSKKAYCSCGYSLDGNSKVAPNKNRFVNYRCSYRQSRGKVSECKASEIRRDWLEAVVLSALEDFLLDDKLIPIVTKALNHQLLQPNQAKDIPVAKIQKQIKELEKERTNIINAIAQTGFDDVFTQKLSHITSAITSAKALINSSALEPTPPEPVRQDTVRKLFKQGYIDPKQRNVPALRKLIETYIDRVVVDSDSIDITMKLAIPNSSLPPYLHTVQIARPSLKASA